MTRGARVVWLTLTIAATAAAPAAAQRDTVAGGAGAGRRNFAWGTFALGVGASLAVHEVGHASSSLLLGGYPSVYVSNGRPVVRSNLPSDASATRRFIFSASGMTLQLLLNEALLDWPGRHGAAGAFERGLLAGGVGTVAFYFTVARSQRVSDVHQMAANSGIGVWGWTAIYGGVVVSDVVRMATKERYAHFFAVPEPAGGLRLGVARAF